MLKTSFHVIFGHLYTFFGEISIQTICPFFNWILNHFATREVPDLLLFKINVSLCYFKICDNFLNVSKILVLCVYQTSTKTVCRCQSLKNIGLVERALDCEPGGLDSRLGFDLDCVSQLR